MNPEPCASCVRGSCGWSKNCWNSGGSCRMRLRMSCGRVVCSAATDTTAGVTRSATETNAFWESSSDELETSETLEPLVCAPSMRVQSIEDAKKRPAMNATAPTARNLDLER